MPQMYVRRLLALGGEAADGWGERGRRVERLAAMKQLCWMRLNFIIELCIINTSCHHRAGDCYCGRVIIMLYLQQYSSLSC